MPRIETIESVEEVQKAAKSAKFKIEQVWPWIFEQMAWHSQWMDRSRLIVPSTRQFFLVLVHDSFVDLDEDPYKYSLVATSTVKAKVEERVIKKIAEFHASQARRPNIFAIRVGTPGTGGVTEGVIEIMPFKNWAKPAPQGSPDYDILPGTVH